MNDAAHLQTLKLLLSVGGVVGEVTLRDASPALVQAARRQFGRFSLPNAPDVARSFTLDVLCTSGPTAPAAERPGVVSDGSRIDIRRSDFAVRLVSEGARFRAAGRCVSDASALRELLKVIWSALLPRAGGGLVRSCGLRDGERAVLAVGLSAGERMALAGLTGDDLVGGELAAVHRDSEGRWRVSGTPFGDDALSGADSLQSWPLAGIAFCEGQTISQMDRVATAEAVLQMLGCLQCFEGDAQAVQRNFSLAISLCSDVPPFTCHLRGDDDLEALRRAWNPYLDRRKTLRPPSLTHRELIGALRTSIERHGGYAFAPRGSSMRPWLRTGDSLFVEAVDLADVRTGDVVLYWRAGRTPEQDALICHRVLGRRSSRGKVRIYAKGDSLSYIESFDDGQEAQVIGRVRAVSRGSHSWSVPGRLGNIAMLLGSLLLTPLYKLRSHH